MACDVTTLSAKNESGGDPAAIGYDAAGGWSYGAVQIATKVGAMAEYLHFLQQSYPFLYTVLNNAGGNAAATEGSIAYPDPRQIAFKNAWVGLATAQRDSFLQSQHQFIIKKYYTVALDDLAAVHIDLSKRSCAIQNVVFSLSVMAGPGKAVANGKGSCGLIVDAVQALGGIERLNALSDASILNEIYACKLKRIDSGAEYASVTPAIRASVRARMVREQHEALTMLAAETQT